MRLVLVLTALVLASPAFAQVTVGVRAGVNSASVYGVEARTFAQGNRKEVILGLTGGVFADVPVAPFVGLRLEGLYSQKGLGIRTYESSAGLDGQFRRFESLTTLRADYIETPLLVRVSVPVRSLNVGAVAGPALAFKVRESVSEAQRFDGEGIIPPDLFPDPDSGDSFQSVDVGGVLGAHIGSGLFSIDLRYTFGALGTARASPDFPDDDLQTVRNGVLTVGTAYRLGL